MKKQMLLFPIIIFCFILNLSFQTYYFINPFKHNEVKKQIDYLSSDHFKGRLAGTLENVEAAIYIKNKFISNGLLPFENSYMQSFDTVYPHKLPGNAYLTITDKNGTLVKEYKYGINYKEDLLNFKANNLSFNKKDKVSLNKEYIQVQKGNNHFLFYTPKDNKLNFRSSFISSSPHSMYIMVTKDTLSELQQHLENNNTINCFIPFESKKTSLINIIGYIKGKDTKAPPIVVSGHFDHLGSDLSETIYKGALDNASGMAFVIEISRYIKSLGKPNRDIIFVGFNAEEFGCLGSKAFVDKYKYNLIGSKIFNFDMVGSTNSVPIYVMGGKKDTKDTPLIKEISSVFEKNKISFNYLFEDASDHEYFRDQGIDAVTLCDADSSRIHTPDDKINFISTDSMDRCFKVVSQEVIKHAFSNNLLLIFYKQAMIVSLLGLIVSYKIYTKYSS
ncbi:M28 family metallopeptidase [Clostridium sp. DJ247]|uniref:M28 family metallopeptidase n=1 Tax=Clostridium sp. DJ247 TaxID=2726188 RepID=UPI00162685C2|nr:M28 family metallopeptidase [Clostridium sp. DJ247]MBC2582237.1 Zn-dependent exopeptidase M28 [Clostridium sp. DJ247]